MKIDHPSSEFAVRDAQPLRLTAARGCAVQCLRGTLWITQAGRLEDVFLRAGEGLRLSSDGVVLVEGVGEAVAKVMSAALVSPASVG